MTPDRVLQFIKTVYALQKVVQRLKFVYAPVIGVKGMHLLWLCELQKQPEGLSISALARCSGVDRALVSREISELKTRGYVTDGQGTGKRNYNAPLQLTARGMEAASRIGKEALHVQMQADQGITEEELKVFYQVSQKLADNLNALARTWGDRFPEEENTESTENTEEF